MVLLGDWQAALPSALFFAVRHDLRPCRFCLALSLSVHLDLGFSPVFPEETPQYLSQRADGKPQIDSDTRSPRFTIL